MGLYATDLWDQELFCSSIQIHLSFSEKTISSSGMKTVCWLEEHWSKFSKDWENIWPQKLARPEVTETEVTPGLNRFFWTTRKWIGKVHASFFLACRLAPILLDLLSMLKVYIWLGLVCLTSVPTKWSIPPLSSSHTALPMTRNPSHWIKTN